MSHPNRIVYGVTVPSSALSLLRGQLEWLAERGWDVHLVTADGPEMEELRQRPGVTCHIIDMEREPSPISDLKAVVAWVRLLRRLAPSIVNLGTPKASLLGGIAAWLTCIPSRIYVVWGLRLEGFTGWRRAVFWLFESLTMLTATLVLPISDSLARRIRELRLVPRRRIAEIIGSGSSNGVDAAGIQAGAAGRREPTRKELGIASDAFVVGFVGRLVRDKGIDTLARALRDPRLADVTCLVVGNEEEGGLADELRASGRVVWAGYVEGPWAQLAAMDVLCLPTKREGFPNVVLEAASVGVPTVTTRATGAIDSVVDGVTGLQFDYGDAIGLADALVRIRDEPELRDHLGTAARLRAETEFAPQRVWQGLDELYRSTRRR
mgnify:FL=1